MTDILTRLKNVRRSGKGWTARCPAHEDKQNSLSAHDREGKWLVKCHAGCTWDAIIAAIGVTPGDLFDTGEGRRRTDIPPNNSATVQPLGLTLEQYAAAKALPIEFLKSCGLSDVDLDGKPAVRIRYLGPTGEDLAIRFRIALDGDRFRWKSGSKPCLYGLNRINAARASGYVVLAEGESDIHTLWHHGIPAIGVPGATNWREDRDAKCFDGIDTIYIVIEPDKGGQSVRKWLAQSAIRTRAKLLQLPAKDPSAMHMADPACFKRAWQVALLGASPANKRRPYSGRWRTAALTASICRLGERCRHGSPRRRATLKFPLLLPWRHGAACSNPAPARFQDSSHPDPGARLAAPRKQTEKCKWPPRRGSC